MLSSLLLLAVATTSFTVSDVLLKRTVIYRWGFYIYFVFTIRMNDVETNEKNENKLKIRDQVATPLHGCMPQLSMKLGLESEAEHFLIRPQVIPTLLTLICLLFLNCINVFCAHMHRNDRRRPFRFGNVVPEFHVLGFAD